MKRINQLFAFINRCPFLMPIAFIGVVFFNFGLNSCKSGAVKTASNKDTVGPVLTLYHELGKQYQMAPGKYTISKIKSADTINDVVKIMPDTNWVLYIDNRKDTIRDVNKKPQYDSVLHDWKFNKIWYPLNKAEKEVVKVQIVAI